MANTRGTIAFFTTYRPPVPLDVYSCPIPPTSKKDEVAMLDGKSYNYNGKAVPDGDMLTLMKNPKFALATLGATEADVQSGRLSGMVFVSERNHGLETLHIAIRFNRFGLLPQFQVFNFADLVGTYNGVRVEDSGQTALGGDYLVYVSTMEPHGKRRQPWTAVFKTHIGTGKTDRITPPGVADLSPCVSPSGKKIALASFEQKPGGWTGEIEDLKTDIFVMNLEEPYNRTLVVNNGGWPTWGSDDVLFFHRKVDNNWGVFRADISNGLTTDTPRVTPDNIDAMTPAAINATTVAVATIREKSGFDTVRVEAQYRHIEVFDSTGLKPPVQITQKTTPLGDHFNPFVIAHSDGTKIRIGYHRSSDVKIGDNMQSSLHEIQSPDPSIQVCRAAGVFPTFSKDGSKIAFVDNEFKAVYVADDFKGLRVVYQSDKPNSVFSPVWNRNPKMDTLYVCMGPTFDANATVQICALINVSGDAPTLKQLTAGEYNNAFPSTNAEGTRLVFRSTRDGGDQKHKNLYIMEDAQLGELGGKVTRLTNGPWTDTHCDWCPSGGDWIVYSSTRDKPADAPPLDNGLDPGYFAVFLTKADDPNVVVRVVGSGYDLGGHVNHPFFSPDGKSIVVVSDLAAVSVDPISLPLFLHSVRPYGDIFSIDIDPTDIHKNQDVQNFNRITHSKFENSTANWAFISVDELIIIWERFLSLFAGLIGPICPFLDLITGGQSFHMTGHLIVPHRLC